MLGGQRATSSAMTTRNLLKITRLVSKWSCSTTSSFLPCRTSFLLPNTLSPCTLSPPSSPMRRWCTAQVQAGAWTIPPSRVTSPSTRRLWPVPRWRCRAHVSDANRWGVRIKLILNACLFSAPSSKKGGCCNRNPKCYAGIGGVILVLGLLALAIWLGGMASWTIKISPVNAWFKILVTVLLSWTEFIVITQEWLWRSIQTQLQIRHQ